RRARRTARWTGSSWEEGTRGRGLKIPGPQGSAGRVVRRGVQATEVVADRVRETLREAVLRGAVGEQALLRCIADEAELYQYRRHEGAIEHDEAGLFHSAIGAG